MSIFFTLFIISIPIFYIIGIVHTINSGRKKSNPSIVEFLENFLKTSPDISVSQLLAELKGKPAPIDTTAIATATVDDTQPESETTFFSNNWYSTNSINILLYVGAFLIVTAAVYFVRFQWTNISGIGKAGIFSVFSLVFLTLGIWWEKLPKIKLAGITFISIGAVLLPLSGIAWYNFVFLPLGVSLGTVWLTTSILTIGLYSLLLYRYQQTICTYSLNIAVFSSIISIVNLGQFDSNVYLLASLSYALAMLIISRFLSPSFSPKLVHDPISSTAHTVMPISLAFGLITAINNDKFLTIETAYGLILGVIFYSIAYYFGKKTWQLGLGLVLLPLAILSFLGWLQIVSTNRLIFLSVISLMYALTSFLVNDPYQVEKKLTLVISFCLSLGLLFWAQIIQASPSIICYLIIVPAIVSLLAAFSLTIPKLSTIFPFLAVYSLSVLTNQVLGLNYQNPTLPVILISITCTIFALGEAVALSSIWSQSILFSSIIFAISSLIFSPVQSAIQLVSLLVMTVLTIRHSYRIQNKTVFYGSLVLLTWATGIVLSLLKIPTDYFILGYAVYAILLYIASFGLPQFYSQSARFGALAIILFSTFYYSQNSQSEKLSLISFYLATALFTTETFIYKKIAIGYLASALGMITYLWQINYLGASETLAYNIPVGIYFMALAQHRRRSNDQQIAQVLDIVGFIALMFPPFTLAFGIKSVFYSLTLGAIGAILLSLGITIRQKMMTNAGFVGIVLSVLPQTYQYALKLPRFALIGICGLIFLIVAIYLLWKRSDRENS